MDWTTVVRFYGRSVFVISPQLPGQLWDPLCLPLNRYRYSVLGGKATMVKNARRHTYTPQGLHGAVDI